MKNCNYLLIVFANDDPWLRIAFVYQSLHIMLNGKKLLIKEGYIYIYLSINLYVRLEKLNEVILPFKVMEIYVKHSLY